MADPRNTEIRQRLQLVLHHFNPYQAYLSTSDFEQELGRWLVEHNIPHDVDVIQQALDLARSPSFPWGGVYFGPEFAMLFNTRVHESAGATTGPIMYPSGTDPTLPPRPPTVHHPTPQQPAPQQPAYQQPALHSPALDPPAAYQAVAHQLSTQPAPVQLAHAFGDYTSPYAVPQQPSELYGGEMPGYRVNVMESVPFLSTPQENASPAYHTYGIQTGALHPDNNSAAMYHPENSTGSGYEAPGQVFGDTVGSFGLQQQGQNSPAAVLQTVR
jgi:hypothetical protein